MRRGRRPGASVTRDRILEAARHHFAEGGYDATSLRAIAASAEVDPALILHFFGSKRRLFQDAIGWPFDPAQALARLGARPDGAASALLGGRLTRLFFEMWDDPATGPALLAVLRGAVTDEHSARLLRELLVQQVMRAVSHLSAKPIPPLPLQLAAGHLLGVALLRHGLRLEPIASAKTEELVQLVTPAVERYLDS